MNTISLEDRIGSAYKIWMNAKITYFYSEYMDNPNTKEEKDFISKSRHFNNISHSMFRVLILELSKLVNHTGSNDKFTIPKLFQELKTFERGASETHEIVELEEKFNEHGDLIKDILKLRNKLYAHYDKQEIDFKKLGITFPKLDKLIYDLGTILHTIANTKLKHHLVVDAYFGPEEKENWDDFLLLSQARENRRNSMSNKRQP